MKENCNQNDDSLVQFPENFCALIIIEKSRDGVLKLLEKGCTQAVIVRKQSFDACGIINFCNSFSLNMTCPEYGVDYFVTGIFAKENILKDIRSEIINEGTHIIENDENRVYEICCDEAWLAYDALCNKNTIDFLSNAETDKWPRTTERIKKFRIEAEKNGVNTRDCIIDSSTVLDVWGIREANDLDYIHITKDESLLHSRVMENHASQLKFYSVGRRELVDNPDYFFTYLGVKFVCLKMLGEMKAARGEEKDVADLVLINKTLRHINPDCVEIKVAGHEWRSSFTAHLLDSYPSVREGRYKIERGVMPDLLLVPQRFDIAAKLYYIDYREGAIDRDFAEEIYGRHIEAFSGGKYQEPGDDTKYTLAHYMEQFNELIEKIKDKGFDEKKSVVPIGINGAFLDGSHRAAATLYYRKPLTIARIEDECVDYDYRFFERHRLSRELMGYMAIRYVEAYKKDNIYFACLWPRCTEKYQIEILSRIETKARVIYTSDIKIERQGLRNLMIQIYEGNEWIGDIDNHFAGVLGKVTDCYRKDGVLKCILFEAENLDMVRDMKQEYRALTGMANSALHISDNRDESLRLARLLFHSNSVYAFEYGILDNSKECDRLVHSQTEYFGTNVTLSIFGVRRFVMDSGAEAKYTDNPRNYFWWYDKKIPTLSYAIKNADISEKERNCIKGLLAKDKNTAIRREWNYFVTRMHWVKNGNWFRRIIMIGLRKIGIFETVRKVYRKVKNIGNT